MPVSRVKNGSPPGGDIERPSTDAPRQTDTAAVDSYTESSPPNPPSHLASMGPVSTSMFAAEADRVPELDPRWRAIYDKVSGGRGAIDFYLEVFESNGEPAVMLEKFLLANLFSESHIIPDELRGTLTPDECAFLIEVARRNLKFGYVSSLVYFFRALHDFDGLRLLLQQLPESEQDHRLRIVSFLEDFHDLFDCTYSKSYQGVRCLERLFMGREVEVKKNYVTRHGFDAAPGFDLLKTASNLTTLSDDYDVFIAIARGGLFSGSIADLLGLPNLVVDVHAHERELPEARWVSDVKLEDIAGKRVLLLDKDAVTGASIEWALKLVAPYGPAKVGVYFNHNRKGLADGGPVTSNEAIEKIEDLGIKVYYPAILPPAHIGRMFFMLNELLNTPLGMLMRVERAFNDEIIPRVRRINPQAADAVQRYIEDKRSFYFSLNQFLPGMDEVRSYIISGLEGNLDLFRQILSYAVSIMTPESAVAKIRDVIGSQAGLPSDVADMLAKGRYLGEGQRLASERDVKNEHIPHSFTSAFRTAKEALERGGYDVALLVGPEGFAYEPIFRDLGIPTVAVNIPESDFGGRRTLKKFDDLSKLRGKRVLVVEDDVHSGATLRRLLRTLNQYGTTRLGLYLGSTARHQNVSNVPPQFRHIYVAEANLDEDSESFLRHLSKRERIFKYDEDIRRFAARRTHGTARRRCGRGHQSHPLDVSRPSRAFRRGAVRCAGTRAS